MVTALMVCWQVPGRWWGHRHRHHRRCRTSPLARPYMRDWPQKPAICGTTVGGAIDTTSPVANRDDIVQRFVGPDGHGWYTSQSTLPSRGCTAATVASYIHDAATLNDDPISRARLVAACVDNNITGMAVRTMSMDDVFERAIVDHPLRQRGYRSNLR
jgi:hypothetical protein